MIIRGCKLIFVSCQLTKIALNNIIVGGEGYYWIVINNKESGWQKKLASNTYLLMGVELIRLLKKQPRKII